MADARVHLLISGRVQGVAYRAHTEAKANSLGLTGWVRNLPAGQVEVVAEGPEEKLEELIAWCRVGPPAARVKDVDVNRAPATGEFSAFDVTR